MRLFAGPSTRARRPSVGVAVARRRGAGSALWRSAASRSAAARGARGMAGHGAARRCGAQVVGKLGHGALVVVGGWRLGVFLRTSLPPHLTSPPRGERNMRGEEHE